MLACNYSTYLQFLLLLQVATIYTRAASEDELGKAASLFAGPLEVVVEHEEFAWLESPVWSDDGNFLLFSDVKWIDENNVTCGMIWKWDETSQEISKFIPCSGLIGPGDTPDNIADYVEAGSNGLEWGWKGQKDLLICQHGKHRIVRIDLDDVDSNGAIDPSLVQVLVDTHNGMKMNSPNDMTRVGDTLYFTDPPFGLQYFSEDDPVSSAFKSANQDIGIYAVSGDPGENTPVEPERLINFGVPDPWKAPNGIALNEQGDIFTPITDFNDPHFRVYKFTSDRSSSPDPVKLIPEFRIEGENSGYIALTDGVTYSSELDTMFASGPGGIYMYDGTSFEYLGFLRLDDLCANSVIGGGYLWLTVNTRIMRIPLATPKDDDNDDEESSSLPLVYFTATTIFMAIASAFFM